MGQKASKIEITGTLTAVHRRRDKRYSFIVNERAAPFTPKPAYQFYLSENKALKLANKDGQFPLGANLRLSGRISKRGPTTGGAQPLNFAKIRSVDGHDVQSWAERHGSPTVAPDVLADAEKAIQEADEAMKLRSPDKAPPAYSSPEEAYETAMFILRRQVKSSNPKLSKADVWALRDALNLLYKNESA